MIFDNKTFKRVVLEFLGDSVKHANEIESCWSQIKQCIALLNHLFNMSKTDLLMALTATVRNRWTLEVVNAVPQ